MNQLRNSRILVLFAILFSGAWARADVNISNVVRTWVPANVTVQAGEAVHWTWTSLHNVAEVGGPADNSWNGVGFYSGAPSNGGAFSHTFPAPGLYYYVCELHAGLGMRGTVTVTDPCADPTPPATVLSIVYNPGSETVTLSWNAITESLEGCPLTPTYLVWGGPSPADLSVIAVTSTLSLEIPAVDRACFEITVQVGGVSQ